MEKAEKKKGALAIAALAAANVASFLGSLEKIRTSLFELVGYHGFEFIHRNLTAIVSAGLLLGYGGVLYLVWKNTQHWEPRRKKMLLSVLTPMTLLLFAMNVAAVLPSEPHPREIVPHEVKKWTLKGFALQREDGSFRLDPSSPESEGQVWSTAQYLLGILSAGVDLDERQVAAVRSAFAWIETQRLGAEGEGWGYVQASEWGVTEVASWVVLAKIASLEVDPPHLIWSAEEVEILLAQIERDLDLIAARQLPNGGWSPVREITDEDYTRTYSTAMALWSLAEARISPAVRSRVRRRFNAAIRNGTQWLLNNYQSTDDRGWDPNPNRALISETYPGLVAQVLFVIGRVNQEDDFFRHHRTYEEAVTAFLGRKDLTEGDPARNARSHDGVRYLPGSPKSVETMTFLWYPWSLAVARQVRTTAYFPERIRRVASRVERRLEQRVHDLAKFSNTEFSYVPAESLFCVAFGRSS